MSPILSKACRMARFDASQWSIFNQFAKALAAGQERAISFPDLF
jgi:hypothetical protein